jgi:peptidoglycan/xylan/chitin deacetylase (PgdA/CDA1 family)
MSDYIVLNFHGVGRPERPLDSGEAPYWLDRDQFAAILDRVLEHPQRDRIRITFDDGNRSDRTLALPMLHERGLVADFFVLTGRIGLPGSLDIGDIRALLTAGMGLGSHGVAHVDWSRLTSEALATELRASKMSLEAICGQPVKAAAIPFGRYSGKVLRALHAAGYKIAYSSDGGSMRERDFPRPRTSVRRDWAPAMLEAVLSGRQHVGRRLHRALRITYRRWLS